MAFTQNKKDFLLWAGDKFQDAFFGMWAAFTGAMIGLRIGNLISTSAVVITVILVFVFCLFLSYIIERDLKKLRKRKVVVKK